jgi:hypothetical protein
MTSIVRIFGAAWYRDERDGVSPQQVGEAFDLCGRATLGFREGVESERKVEQLARPLKSVE